MRDHYLDCDYCQHSISDVRGHYITTDKRLLCRDCLRTPDLHALFWPHCQLEPHDELDHLAYVAATRSTAYMMLRGYTFTGVNCAELDPDIVTI